MEFRQAAIEELFQFQHLALVVEVRPVSLSPVWGWLFPLVPALSGTIPAPHRAHSLKRVFFSITGLTGSGCSAGALLVRVGRCRWGEK